MLNKLLDRFIVTSGDWNAQLFRELKSRLTAKNFVITTACSLLAQGWFLISALQKLPNSSVGSANGRIDTINWPQWWIELFTDISGLMTASLVVLGVYFLARDLRTEEKRGTLNFVQLSPQSAWDIFIGKILGVPVLFHLAIGLAIPLQLTAGAYSNFGLFHTILWDLWWLVIIASFYLGAMLLSAMPVIITLFAWGLQTLIFLLMKYVLGSAIGNSFSFMLREGVVLQDVSWAILFGTGICSLVAYCLWGLLEYCYNDPISRLED